MCKSEGDSQRETHAQSLKWDIYSLAMTFCYLFARAPPFPNLTHEQVRSFGHDPIVITHTHELAASLDPETGF